MLLKRVLLVAVYSLPQEVLLLHRLCCSSKISADCSDGKDSNSEIDDALDNDLEEV